MDPTAKILTQFERCNRAEFYSRDWEPYAWEDLRFLQEALRVSLTSDREDHGEQAGEEVVSFARERSIAGNDPNQWDQAVHLANLADILSTALRRPGNGPWRVPEPVELGRYVWRPGAFLAPSGDELRRIVLVSRWSDERHYHECRVWDSMGEICAYGLPMRLAVCIIGPRRDGRRHSFLSRGYLHPFNHKVRFRKKHDVETGFKETWTQRWRHDEKDISTEEWLQAMVADGVMKDVVFSVDIAVPESDVRKRVLDLAVRNLDRMAKTEEMPDFQLTGCDWPARCPFIGPCHRADKPSGKYGLIKIA